MEKGLVSLVLTALFVLTIDRLMNSSFISPIRKNRAPGQQIQIILSHVSGVRKKRLTILATLKAVENVVIHLPHQEQANRLIF